MIIYFAERHTMFHVNYYKVLNVANNATLTDIQQSYDSLLIKKKSASLTEIDAITQWRNQHLDKAYEVLSNDLKRKSHDAEIALSQKIADVFQHRFFAPWETSVEPVYVAGEMLGAPVYFGFRALADLALSVYLAITIPMSLISLQANNHPQPEQTADYLVDLLLESLISATVCAAMTFASFFYLLGSMVTRTLRTAITPVLECTTEDILAVANQISIGVNPFFCN